jgi:subtilase family serine protease
MARAAPLGVRTRLVRIGQLSAIQLRSTILGKPANNSPVTFDVILRPRDAGQLSQQARAVTTAGSPQFRHFLSRGAFAREFGATTRSTRRVEGVLSSLGLHDSVVSSNHLAIVVHASIAATDRALHTNILRYRAPSGAIFEAPNALPALPSSLSADVSTFLGLDTAPALSSAGLVHEAPLKATRPRLVAGDTYSGTESAGCEADINAARAGLTPDQVAGAYGLSPLYQAGDFGSGVTIGVIEFSPFIAGDLATYSSCLGIVPAITEVAVAGGPIGAQQQTGAVAGDMLESELDLEDLIGLAPGASIIDYEGPSQGGNISNAAAYDDYATAVDADAAQIITTSYGVCEAALTPDESNAENVVFEQAALQGQTIIAASGDSGSEDCNNGIGSSSRQTALAVDDPASQPYVTGVGGTTLTLAPQRSEVVWNTGETSAYQASAGGGGVSSVWPIPSYQANAAPTLGVAQAGSAAGTCAIAGGCREVPDVAMDAGSPYAIYCTIAGAGCGTDGSNWAPLGGTSAAAPAFAAIIALADSSEACSSISQSNDPTLGFVNPGLYAIASGPDYLSAFTDIVSGSNDLLGIHGGVYSATPGYDLASGLGSPIASSASDIGLVTDLCDAATLSEAVTEGGLSTPALRSLSPPSASSRGGKHVSIRGYGLRGAVQVLFGAVPSPKFEVLSNTHIVATAPPGTGRVHVVVIGRGGASPHVRSATFSYLNPPSVSRISARFGPRAGHNTVVIIGKDFGATSSVKFGSHQASSFKIRSTTRIVATVPAGQGVVRVTVTTKIGHSAAVTGDRYTYR